MLKVLVVTLRDLDDKIENKYPGINKALKNLGYDVWYTGIRNNTIYLCNSQDMIKVGKITCTYPEALVRVYKYQNFYNALINIIVLGYCFDYCYFRSTIQIGAYGKALLKLKQSGLKVIVEVPTHPCKKEYKSDKRIWRKPIYNIMAYNEEHNAKHVDLYVLIGEKDSEYLGRPAINIENGVNLEDIRIRKASFDTDNIHIIAVAKMAQWHGYDRLIEGLQLYKQNGRMEKVIIHMVGPEGDGSLAEWLELSNNYGLENEIIFEGPMYGKELANLFDCCDVAIASLGMYRKNMNITSELKIREYMARGIPIIYATNDSAINEKWDYCLRVPNDSDPINMEQVINFAKKMRKNKNIPTEMRDYAAKHITWEKQFEKVFDWFQQRS